MKARRFFATWSRALVAANLALLTACGDAPTGAVPSDVAQLGVVPTAGGAVAPGDGALFPEQLEVCKVWANGATPTAIQVRLQVTGSVTKDTIVTIPVNAGQNASGASIQCGTVWTNSRITADLVTVTEVVPNSGYTTDWKLETILFPLRQPFVIGPTTTGAGSTVASITIGGPGNNPGGLLTFTNTPIPTGSIGDFVWNDLNADGVQDVGEPGLINVPLDLIQNGNVIASTTTDGSGNYAFVGLSAGDYTVCVSVPPAGLIQTYDLDGISTAHCATATLTTGQNRTDVDFGYVNLGSIGDRVWNDVNGDGVQDPGEAGLTVWTVTLYNTANVAVATTSTGANGIYGFAGLIAGTYKVCVTPASLYTQTYDLDGLATAHCATATLAAGQNRSDVDFGYVQLGSIGDRVWNDVNGDGVQDASEVGLNGWTVTLRNAANVVIGTASTAGNGTYTFGSLFGGTYSVCVSPASGYTQTYDLDGLATPHCATATLATAQNRTDVDFGYLVPIVTGGQGCTPGYWKQPQHFDSWKVYATTNKIDAVFNVTFRSVGKNNPTGPLTLLQALGLNGNNDGEQLFRHGTAALLNSVSTSGVNSNYTSTQVIKMVHDAWVSGNAATIANTKNLLAAANEQGCPLN